MTTNIEKKKWLVAYSHKDGRHGTVEVTTEIGESGAFDYGNKKWGSLTVGDFEQPYDLRYIRGEDLHMAMLKNFFGDGIVKATEI